MNDLVEYLLDCDAHFRNSKRVQVPSREGVTAYKAAADEIAHLRAELAAHSEAVQGLVEALTPSAATKAAYMGEFSFTIEDTDDEWGLPITRHLDVPWTTVKEIMAAIRTHAALKGPSNG